MCVYTTPLAACVFIRAAHVSCEVFVKWTFRSEDEDAALTAQTAITNQSTIWRNCSLAWMLYVFMCIWVCASKILAVRFFLPSRKDISDQCIRAKGQDEAGYDAHIQPRRQQLCGKGKFNLQLMNHPETYCALKVCCSSTFWESRSLLK